MRVHHLVEFLPEGGVRVFTVSMDGHGTPSVTSEVFDALEHGEGEIQPWTWGLPGDEQPLDPAQ